MQNNNYNNELSQFKNIYFNSEYQQGSEEWKGLRLGKITASNFSKIITRSAKYSSSSDQLAFNLASEIYLQYKEDSYITSYMQNGIDLEPQAVEAYEQHCFESVDRDVAFFDCGDYGYSPDGLVGEDGLIEVKCPKSTTHFKYIKEDKVPDEHYAQCQGGLMVTGRKWIDFISYNENVVEDKRLFVKRCYRDEDFISSLLLYINLTIQKRNKHLNQNNQNQTNAEYSIGGYEIEEIDSTDINTLEGDNVEIEDYDLFNQIDRYQELEPLAKEFARIKASVESKSEAIHLANDKAKVLKVKDYNIVVSYTVPQEHTEKSINKAIESATEKLEKAINLQQGMLKSEPSFKIKIVKAQQNCDSK